MEKATEITDHVLVGPLSVARDLEELERLGVTAVVCVAAEGRSFFPYAFAYYEAPHLAEHSCGIVDVIGILKDVWKFVEDKLQSNNSSQSNTRQRIYFHCVHGRTRSVSVASYVLAKQHGVSIAEAYKMILAKREVFVPGAWLDALEQKLGDSGEQAAAKSGSGE